MTDRTPDQINHNLDQVMAISAENTININRLELSIEQTNESVRQTNQALAEFIASGKTRLLSLETSRELEEEKVEALQNNATRLERSNLEHQARLDRMDEIIARYDRMHLEHEGRIARQDRLIELLSQQLGEA